MAIPALTSPPITPLPLPSVRQRFWIWLLPCLAAFAAGIYVLLKTLADAEPGYRFFCALPFAYSLLLLCAGTMRRHFTRPCILFMNAYMFVRYVAVPVLTVWAGAYEGIGIQPEPEQLDKAVWLMLYEMAAGIAAIELFGPWLLHDPKPRQNFRRFRMARWQIVAPVVILAGFWLIYANPGNLRENFRFFLDAVPTTEEMAQGEETSRGEGAGLAFMLAATAKLLFSLYVVNWCKARYDKRPSFLYVLLSLAAFLPNILFTVGTSRYSIVTPAIAAILLLNVLYPAYKGKTTALLFAGLLVIFAHITLHKNFSADQQKSGDVEVDQVKFATNLQAYGSTTRAVAMTIKAKERFGKPIDLGMLKNDLFLNTPGLSRLSDKNRTSTAYFNWTIYGELLSVDQIIPMVGQGYLHWGFLLAPMYSVGFVLFLMWLDRLALREFRPEFYFLLMMTVFQFSGVWISNLGLALGHISGVLLPRYLVLWANRTLSPASQENGMPAPPPAAAVLQHRPGA